MRESSPRAEPLPGLRRAFFGALRFHADEKRSNFALGHVKALRFRLLVTAVGIIGPALLLGGARADEATFDGRWAMSALNETFVVQQWGRPCGPAPVSGVTLPAGTVTIRGERGELVIAGAQRTFRTDACIDPMPTLAPRTHSHEARSWRTECVTPPSDPRHAIVNTAFFVIPGDDAISVAETGRYEFTVSDERCVADVKRSASLNRVSAPAPPQPAAAAEPERTAVPAVPRGDCASPGEPVRLEVRPSRKLLRLGEAFSFRGVVVDAQGCATQTPIQWSVGAVAFQDGKDHVARPTIDAGGKLLVPRDDFSDAAFDVIATAGGRAAHASVEATSPANFEALLAQSGLDSKGERAEPSTAALATSTIGATRANAEDGAARRRATFATVVGVLALILGAVAVFGARRTRNARQAERVAEERHTEKMREYEQQKHERERQHADQMRAHIQSVAIAQQQRAAAAARGIDSGPSFCPSCRREFTSAGPFCPFDANRLIAIAGHEELLAGPAGGICPVCKRGFNPGVRVCPHDGEELIPPVVATTQTATTSLPPTRGKICPTCGGRFEGTAAFCGKDGTQLVLLN